jgi:bacteriocin leader peptide (microcyclamide/patellamide family)
MGKKNIQPNSSQPVFRSLVARPALEELREENLTEGNQGHGPYIGGPGPSYDTIWPSCSYDGDDE